MTRTQRRQRQLPLMGGILAIGIASTLLAAPLSAAPEPGTPVVVNSTGNAFDSNPGDGVCETGGTNSEGQLECTLQAAIRETNNGNADHIHFNIPTSDPGYDGTRWRISIGSTLPSLGHDTEIEGNTQPGFIGTPVIELHNTGNASTGIRFSNADGGSLEYLAITNFTSHGVELSNAHNIRVANNRIGLTPTDTNGGNGGDGVHIHGGSQRNIVENIVIGFNAGTGIEITAGSRDTAVDSNFIGTIRGQDYGNAQHGIHLLSGAHDTTIGTTTGNVVGRNGGDGVRLDGVTGTQIFSNTIGLNFSRRNRAANGGNGLLLQSGSTATIGSIAEPNTISGNVLSGIAIVSGSAADVVGNFIGTNPNGKSPQGNRQSGVLVVDSGQVTNVIDNVIQNNLDDGVTVRTQNVLISRNSLLANQDQQIDLNGDGFTPNDAGDRDGGRNDQLNFPEIASVTNTANGASVTLDINVPAGGYTIELFEYEPRANTTFLDIDHFIRSFQFTSDGTATTQTFSGFNATPGHILSATITNPSRNITSEVSPTTIVPAAAIDDSSDLPQTTATTAASETNTGEQAATITPTTTTPPDNTDNAPDDETLPADTPGNDTPPTAAAAAPTGSPNPGAATTPGPTSALPFQDDEGPTDPATAPAPLTETTDIVDETESIDPAEALTVGPADGNADEQGSGNAAADNAADIQSASLTMEAEEAIEETQPELATIEGITFRTGRIANELIDVRLTSFELSSLALAPLLLIGSFPGLRRRSDLVSITRVGLDEVVPQYAASDRTHSLRHDQVVWSTNRTRNVKNEPQTLVETANGGRAWVPTRNIISTGS